MNSIESTPAVPPFVLFHGTPAEAVPRILAEGLKQMGSVPVHLTSDRSVAEAEGGRRGSSAEVLVVEAGRLHMAGVQFFRLSDTLWLTRAVPPEYIRQS